MKRIFCGSVLASCITTAVGIASVLLPSRHWAYAQQILMPGQNVVYYNGYGQGYYGGYAPGYGGTYVFVPNNNYSGYGNGPYGYDARSVNPGYSGSFGARTFGGSAYRQSVRNYGYYQGF
jgi:hypothetical protein